jgi:hypothetical protein
LPGFWNHFPGDVHALLTPLYDTRENACPKFAGRRRMQSASLKYSARRRRNIHLVLCHDGSAGIISVSNQSGAVGYAGRDCGPASYKHVSGAARPGTGGLSLPTMSTSISVDDVPEFAKIIIQAFIDAGIKHSIAHLILGTAYAALLLPLLCSLFVFSTEKNRHQPIFIFVAFDVILGIGVNIFIAYVQVSSVVITQRNKC